MPDKTGASVRRLYDARVVQGLVQDDSAQRGLCDRLDRVIHELVTTQKTSGAKSSPLGWLFSRKLMPRRRTGRPLFAPSVLAAMR